MWEYGKPEPNPRLPYRLVALGSFSSDPQLAFVMKAFGRGEVSQKVAQAVAWHLASGLSWQQLAAEMIDRAGGYPDEPYFAAAELIAAHKMVQLAAERVGPKSVSPLPTATPASVRY